MAGINVKWPGQYIAEDTTHRLVTDDQIEFWNSNGVIELTPDNYKDYVIDEEDLYTPVYDAYNARGHFIENLQPGHYKVKLGYDILLEPPVNRANTGIATLADDGNDNIDNYDWYVKPDWVNLFANVYYDTDMLDNYISDCFLYDYSSIFGCKTFAWNKLELIEYVEFEVFEKKGQQLDYNCVIVSKDHVYYKYDNIINGVQNIFDWDDAINTGIYKTSCDASDSEYRQIPPTDYTGINLYESSEGNSVDMYMYIGRVINSGKKITQEVEFDINPRNALRSARDNFMKALGTKFIRYGFYIDRNKIVWTNWYSINYDLGECDPNIRKLFASDT